MCQAPARPSCFWFGVKLGPDDAPVDRSIDRRMGSERFLQPVGPRDEKVGIVLEPGKQAVCFNNGINRIILLGNFAKYTREQGRDR